MAAPARRNSVHFSKADYEYDDELAQTNRGRDRKARNAYMAALGGLTSPMSVPVGAVGGMVSPDKDTSKDFYSAAVGGLVPGISTPVGLGRGAYLNHKSYKDNRRAGRPSRSHRQLQEGTMSKGVQLSRVSKSEGYIPDPGDASQVSYIELVPTGRQAGMAEGLTHVRNPRGKGGPNKLERYRGGGSLDGTRLTEVGKSRLGRVTEQASQAGKHGSKRARQMSGDDDAWGMDTFIRNTNDASAKSKKRRRAGIAAGAGAGVAGAGGAGYAASRRGREDVGKAERNEDAMSPWSATAMQTGAAGLGAGAIGRSMRESSVRGLQGGSRASRGRNARMMQRGKQLTRGGGALALGSAAVMGGRAGHSLANAQRDGLPEDY